MATRTARVSDEELNKSAFLNVLAGEDNDDNANTGSEDQEQENETDPQDGQDDGDGSGSGNGDGENQSNDGANKQDALSSIRKQTPDNKSNAKSNGNKSENGKPNLDDAQLRQVYNTVKARMQPVFNKLEMEARKANDQLRIYQARDEAVKEYKLNPRDQLDAMHLAHSLRDDPVKTINFLIAKAQAAGHNILGADGKTQIEMRPDTIRNMITEAVAPLTRQQQQHDARQQDIQAAQTEITQFFGKFPDAQVHAAALDHIIQRSPEELSLTDAYYRLKMMYTQHNLDWNVPLGVHLNAAKARDAKNGGKQQQQQDNSRNAFGVRNRQGSVEQQEQQSPRDRGSAPANAKTKDIVKQAMEDAGYNMSRLT